MKSAAGAPLVRSGEKPGKPPIGKTTQTPKEQSKPVQGGARKSIARVGASTPQAGPRKTAAAQPAVLNKTATPARKSVEVAAPTERQVSPVKARLAGVETAPAPQVHAPQVHAPQVQAPQVQAPQVQAPQVQAPPGSAAKVQAAKIQAVEAQRAQGQGADPVPQPAPVSAPARPPQHGPVHIPRPMAKAETFVEGDHVVYPTHGVGKVERIAIEEIAGHKLELIHITFEENRMTLRVPVAKARSAGLRKLATRKMFDEALTVLKGRARIKRTMWSRRAQEYEAKINSGDPLSIAEVVRDLHRNAGQPDQSFSERQIYEAAMDRLAAELAALDKTDKTTAATKLIDFLKTV